MAQILLCDDEQTIVDFISDVLTEAGHAVTGLTDPHAVAAMVEQQAYDLVILDFNMGTMDGKTLLGTIRKKFTPVELPVAFLTGMSDKSTVQDLAKIGISGFLLKPPDLNTFAVKVSSFLAKRIEGETVVGILKLCNFPDPGLQREPGLSADQVRQNGMFRVQWEGRSLVVTLLSQMTAKQLVTKDLNFIKSDVRVFSQLGTRWFRLWPTTWELEAGSKPKGEYDDLLASVTKTIK